MSNNLPGHPISNLIANKKIYALPERRQPPNAAMPFSFFCWAMMTMILTVWLTYSTPLWVPSLPETPYQGSIPAGNMRGVKAFSTKNTDHTRSPQHNNDHAWSQHNNDHTWSQNTIDHAWSHNTQHIDGQAWPIHEQTKDTPLTLLDISDDTRSLSLSIQHSTKYYIVIPLTGLAIIMSNIILHLISNNRKTDNLHKTVHTHRNPIRLEMSRSKIQACSYFRVRVYNRLRGKFRYSRTWWRCYHLATAPPSKTTARTVTQIKREPKQKGEPQITNAQYGKRKSSLDNIQSIYTSKTTIAYEREQDPVLYDLESELMHDMYLPDSEITEEWWECRKHKYVQLHAHCKLKDETTYITLPVAFEHEHATIDKQANIMAGLTPRGRPIKRNIRRFYTKLKNTAQPSLSGMSNNMHFKFEPQETAAFSFGSPSKSPAPTFVFGIPHPKKHQRAQQPAKAGTCEHSVATANSHKLLEINNNLERDRDGWKAAAQAKQTEVETRGLKANEWKAKAHAKQAEAGMWKKNMSGL